MKRIICQRNQKNGTDSSFSIPQFLLGNVKDVCYRRSGDISDEPFFIGKVKKLFGVVYKSDIVK